MKKAIFVFISQIYSRYYLTFMLFVLLQIAVIAAQVQNITAVFIPHSHNDPGWLIPYETYYTNFVQSILNNCVEYLNRNPDFKFVWCESIYLHRWWIDATETKQNSFKKLVSEGRIEIVGGGWVMNDEAEVDYRDMIEQMDIGLSFIYDQFNLQPNTAWQIDPFGHSSTFAAIALKLGFTSIILNRVSSVEKQILRNQSCDFYWEGNPTDTPEVHYSIFSHLLYYHYNQGDIFTNSNFPVDDSSLASYFGKYVKEPMNHTQTPVVPLLYGDDFAYSNYEVFNLAFHFVEEFKKFSDVNYSITVKTSTYSEYLTMISEYKKSYGVFKGDFIPFIEKLEDGRNDYWTGFYSTRPFLKQLISEVMRLIRVNDILLLVAQIQKDNANNIDIVKLKDLHLNTSRNAAILLHHDAITGTHSSVTNIDYMKTGMVTLHQLNYLVFTLIESLAEKTNAFHPIAMDTSIKIKYYTIYNPSAFYRSEVITINTTHQYIIAKRYNGTIIKNCQINKILPVENSYQIVCEFGLEGLSIERIYLTIFQSYEQCNLNCIEQSEVTDYSDVKNDTKIYIENDVLAVSINPYKNHLNWIYDKTIDKVITLNTTLIRFSSNETNSGHYVFNPWGFSRINPINVNTTVQYGKLGYFVKIVANYLQNETFTISFSLLNGDHKFIYADYSFYNSTEGEVQLQMEIKELDPVKALIYASDSMNYVKRIYSTLNESKEKNYFNNVNENENIGRNTYPSVDGFLIREKKNESDLYFAFSHSHPIALSILSPNNIGILLARNLHHLDNKGLNEELSDPFPSILYSQIFVTNSLDEFLHMKCEAYESIHNPFEVYLSNSKSPSKINLLTHEFPKEIELISSKIMNISHSETVCILRVRNNFPYHVKLSLQQIFSNANSTYLGQFSLTGYDTKEQLNIKHSQMKEKIKINETNRLLSNQRASFTLLEEEYPKSSSKVVPNKGEIILNPFELIALKFKIEK